MKQHKWHKEIKAWADGERIEKKVYGMNGEWSDWYDCQVFEWDDETTKYRIKPQVMFNGLTEEETNNTASVKGLTQPKEPQCNPHPKAPHGFNRNASHNSNRYVCDCEGWDAWQDGYEEGLRKGLELEQPKEPQYLYVFATPLNQIILRQYPTFFNNGEEIIGKIKLEDSDA